MYEDNEQPVLRRVLLIVVWLVIIITIAWATIWIAFFRHDNQTNQGTLKHQTTQSTQPPSGTSNSKTQTSGNTPNTGSANQGTTSTPNTSGTGSQQPQALANTGAGNVFIPFTAASIIGTTAYYIRLRKKLT